VLPVLLSIVGSCLRTAFADAIPIWAAYSPENSDLPVAFVTALTLGPDGALWVGTYHGLARFDKEGRWQTYTAASTKGGLPHDFVTALTLGSDEVLWVGTYRGLARLDKKGHWQTDTTASTKGGLPADNVRALSLGADGALWVGTEGGLSHLTHLPQSTDIIVDVVGNFDAAIQREQTFGVVAFDRTYVTPPWMFHYAWRVNDRPEIRTKSPFFKATFDHGTHRLRVAAIDIYGMWSDPRDINFAVTLPRADPVINALVKAAKFFIGTGALYFALIFVLIPLYPSFSLARTAINSGLFTRFPFAHKAILNTHWARRSLFRKLAQNALDTSEFPRNYIPQSVFDSRDSSAKPLLDGTQISLKQLLLTDPRRQLLIARSGTGKSVFLRHLQREMAARFLHGERVPAPLLIDLRVHVLKGRTVQDLIRDALRGAGLELSDGDIEFLIRKGGFLILVDSLNELPDPADAQLFHTFFNQDAGNYVLIASQLDLIRRHELRTLTLAELTPQQIADYLSSTVGPDVYAALPLEAQALARNPQDLTLIAEVVTALGPAKYRHVVRNFIAKFWNMMALFKTGLQLTTQNFGSSIRSHSGW
jgi:hypothetical protein